VNSRKVIARKRSFGALESTRSSTRLLPSQMRSKRKQRSRLKRIPRNSMSKVFARFTRRTSSISRRMLVQSEWNCKKPWMLNQTHRPASK
jgi:hypothetical protein